MVLKFEDWAAQAKLFGWFASELHICLWISDDHDDPDIDDPDYGQYSSRFVLRTCDNCVTGRPEGHHRCGRKHYETELCDKKFVPIDTNLFKMLFSAYEESKSAK